MPKRAGSLKNTIVPSDPPGLCLAFLPERRRASHEKVFCTVLQFSAPRHTPRCKQVIQEGPPFGKLCSAAVNFCAFSRRRPHYQPFVTTCCASSIAVFRLPNSPSHVAKVSSQNSGL